jgi:hypothetical protein
LSLAHLSLYRVPPGRMPPPPPSNTERLQQYRACLPVQFGNAWRLPPTRFQEAM